MDFWDFMSSSLDSLKFPTFRGRAGNPTVEKHNPIRANRRRVACNMSLSNCKHRTSGFEQRWTSSVQNVRLNALAEQPLLENIWSSITTLSILKIIVNFRQEKAQYKYSH